MMCFNEGVNELRTYKSISSISYNTEAYLLVVLESLLNRKIINNYMYIQHEGEKGGKPHFHLYLEPLGTVDTSGEDFTTLFNEDDGSGLPLSVMSWVKSKREDWLLYAIHNKNYLDYKGEKKEVYDYPIENVKSNDLLLPSSILLAIDHLQYMTPIEKMIYCINQDMSVFQAMKKLRIPFSQMSAFQTMWYEIQSQLTPKFQRIVDFNPNTCEKYITYINNVTGEEITEAEYKYKKEKNKIVL